MPATKSKKPYRPFWGKKPATGRTASAAVVAKTREPKAAKQAAPPLPTGIEPAAVKSAIATAAKAGGDPERIAVLESMVRRTEIERAEVEHARLKREVAMLTRVVAQEKRDAADRAVCDRINARIGKKRGSWQRPTKAEPVSVIEASRATASALGKLARKVRIGRGLAIA